MNQTLNTFQEYSESNGFFSIIEYDIDTVAIQDRFVELFSEIQQQYVAMYPGYISSTFLGSTDGKRIYNIIIWESENAFLHFEKISDTTERINAIEKALIKLDNNAHYRNIGSPRYRVLTKRSRVTE